MSIYPRDTLYVCVYIQIYYYDGNMKTRSVQFLFTSTVNILLLVSAASCPVTCYYYSVVCTCVTLLYHIIIRNIYRPLFFILVKICVKNFFFLGGPHDNPPPIIKMIRWPERKLRPPRQPVYTSPVPLKRFFTIKYLYYFFFHSKNGEIEKPQKYRIYYRTITFLSIYSL